MESMEAGVYLIFHAGYTDFHGSPVLPNVKVRGAALLRRPTRTHG